MDESIQAKKERMFSHFEEMGESEVAIRYAHTPGYSANTDMPYAQVWLRIKAEERMTAALAKRDEREEETLSIARRALAHSERANKIAISAIIVVAIATIGAALIGVMFVKP